MLSIRFVKVRVSEKKKSNLKKNSRGFGKASFPSGRKAAEFLFVFSGQKLANRERKEAGKGSRTGVWKHFFWKRKKKDNEQKTYRMEVLFCSSRRRYTNLTDLQFFLFDLTRNIQMKLHFRGFK